MGKIGHATVVIGEFSVVHNLKQDVDEIGVGLFDFVHQHNSVWVFIECFGQLATLFVAYISGGSADQLKKKKINLTVSPEAVRWLFKKGHQPQYGARPFARTVDEQLKKPLVDDILFGSLTKGGRVFVDVKDDQLTFTKTEAVKSESAKK